MDIGATTPGGVRVGADHPLRRRHRPALHEDRRARHDRGRGTAKRVSMQNRAPGLYMLDERTRLAGCHMIRDAVERARARGGRADRQAVHARGDRGRPPRLQAPHARAARARAATAPPASPRRATRTRPRPAEARPPRPDHPRRRTRRSSTRDGRLTTDLRGCSAWGWHSFNATPAAQQGMQWILFTQTLICNDKINDGAYYATELKLTRGQLGRTSATPPARPRSPGCRCSRTSTGYLRAISRALQSARLHRGDRRHLHRARQRRPGRRHRPVRAGLGLHELRDRSPGPGRQVRARRPRLRRRRVQPRGRHGRHRDVGAGQADDLPRPPHQAATPPARAATAAARRSSRCCWCNNTPDFEVENIGAGGMFTSPGIFGGYPEPRPTSTTSTARTSTRWPRRGEAYPVGDVSGEELALNVLGGEHDVKQDPYTLMQAMKHGDIYLSTGRGGGGLGDPLLRSDEAIDEDIAGGHIKADWAERAYGRERPRRCAHAAPRARASRRRVVGRAARAHPRAGPDRAGEGDVRRVDAPRAGLGGGVSAAPGTCRRTSTSTWPRRRARPEGRAGQGHAAGVGGEVPGRRHGLPPRGRVRDPDRLRHDEGAARRPARREALAPRGEGHPVRA